MKSKIYSIHSQLVIFYSLAVVTLMAALAFAYYWETQNLMNQADNSFVSDEVSNIQSIMADKNIDMDLLRKAVIEHPVRTRNSLYRYYIRILDDNGQLKMETPGFSEIAPVAAGFSPANAVQQISEWKIYQDNNYLTMLAPIKLYNGKQQGYVLVALNISFQHTITHDRRIFIGFLIAGMLLSLLLGKIVTRRGLRSLDDLTNTVKNITTSSLNHRVDPEKMPVELCALGRAFNQMLDRIEISFARLHQMSADMSHELRTPITNLIGQTELLLSCEYSKADLVNALASNLEELQRMTSLIENILFLARAESQQPEIAKQLIDVAVEINKIIEYYQPLAEDKSIQLDVKGNGKASVNTVMFRRLMSNLISNAIKYTESDGSVAVTIESHAKQIIIIVSDTGIGISPQHLPRLFDRFFRVDDSRNVSGTGLGLAIVKSIVDLHHGQIQVESSPSIGTSFVIIFPV
jgi:two-component system, OmpR family, heavy metal sensor histidine kinase CusS